MLSARKMDENFARMARSLIVFEFLLPAVCAMLILTIK